MSGGSVHAKFSGLDTWVSGVRPLATGSPNLSAVLATQCPVIRDSYFGFSKVVSSPDLGLVILLDRGSFKRDVHLVPSARIAAVFRLPSTVFYGILAH